MNIEAFILVGGRSSRMGQDKAAVPFEGSPMVARIASAIRDALKGARVRLVAADHEQLLRLGAVDAADGFVFDIIPRMGPAGGLYAALAHTDKEWAFATACDLPLLSSDLIRHLSERLDDEHDATVPLQSDGRPQPLAAFYRVRPVRDRLAELLERPRPTPSMQELLDGMNVRYVPFEDIEHLAGSQSFFTNVNSPEDLSGPH